jgi:hypothetical protein
MPRGDFVNERLSGKEAIMPINILNRVSDSEIDRKVKDFEDVGATVTRIRKDGTWTLVAVRDDPEIEGQRDPTANIAPMSDETPETLSALTNDNTLGMLSERYESNGKPGAIGQDRTGGFSYGLYQIATKTGTMRKFLTFLASVNAHFAATLNAAGGAEGASQGTEAFKTAWRELAEDAAFAEAQHAFIQATLYEPFVDRVKHLDLNVNHHSFALKNVAWSVAVQHGAANSVFKNALSGKQPSSMNDEAIINEVYNERSKVDMYFQNSSAKVKASVEKRFAQEREDALELLKV